MRRALVDDQPRHPRHRLLEQQRVLGCGEQLPDARGGEALYMVGKSASWILRQRLGLDERHADDELLAGDPPQLPKHALHLPVRLMLEDLQANDGVKLLIPERHLLGVHEIVLEAVVEGGEKRMFLNLDADNALEPS